MDNQQKSLPHSKHPQAIAEQLNKANRASIQIKFITNGAVECNLERTSEGIPTVGFQVANVITEDRKRMGDWSNKFQFQLHPDHELIQLIHYLTGRLVIKESEYGLQFKYHGKHNDKMMTFKFNSDGSLVVNGIQKKAELKCNATIKPTAVAQLITLAYKAYAAHFKISVLEAITLLKMSPVAEAPK